MDERESTAGIHKAKQIGGGDFSVGLIVLDFDLKLLLCWTNPFGHTLLGSFVYVVICWAVEDTLCWAVGHWASVALCWAVFIAWNLLGMSNRVTGKFHSVGQYYNNVQFLSLKYFENSLCNHKHKQKQ